MHLLVGAVLAILLYYFFVLKPSGAPEKDSRKADAIEAQRPLDSFDPTGGSQASAPAPTPGGITIAGQPQAPSGGTSLSPAGANLVRPINRTREVLGQVQKRNEE